MTGKMQEINTEKLRELIKKREELHPLDDSGLDKIWADMLIYCGDNEENILLFLSTLSLNELETMSEIFEDISQKLKKSKTFKKGLEKITSKFPNINFCLEYC